MPKIGVKVSGTREYKLLTLLLDYSAESKSQVLCSKIFWELQEKNGKNSPQTERALIRILYNGLEFDIWPWTDCSLPE